MHKSDLCVLIVISLAWSFRSGWYLNPEKYVKVYKKDLFPYL